MRGSGKSKARQGIGAVLRYFAHSLTHSEPTLRQAYLKSILVWNPLITLGFSLLFSLSSHFFRNWLFSLLISSLVSSFCLSSVRGYILLERSWAAFRGLEYRRRRRYWYYLVSLFAMPLGLYLAFSVAGFLFGRVGIPVEVPSLADYRNGVLIGTLIAGVFFLSKMVGDARESARSAELKVKNLENERLQAQIAALTAQMNPHLLFNALNTIAALVPSEPEKAEETILRLSELYRGVLDSSRRTTHSLSTELGLCRAYLAVEHARFGSRLDARIQIAPELDPDRLEVPVLTIQPIVENAVKHGLSSRSAGGRVSVRARPEGDRLKIEVEDDGVGFGHAIRPGAGTGLANCRERLKLTFGENGRLDVQSPPDGGTRIILTMPMPASVTSQTAEPRE